MGKFVVRRTKTGIKFDLKAGNGEVIATSEVYKSERSCLNGLNSVKVNSVGGIEDTTVENYETLKHPKFVIFTDKSGEYRVRLKARNGQIIAVSEGYKTKASCLNGIESVKKNAPEAPVDRQDLAEAE
ncbi:MAG: YegP family protein [Clostridia bacterium]|nr:YegP family protein [Clostridia bacterium]